MRALLLANSDDCDAGFSGERFRHHGYSFLECHRDRPTAWPTLDGVDLVMLLGSEWSVYWPHLRDNVAAELALIREAHARRVPIYGICYGAQTIAAALGGSVDRASEPEIGWYDDVELAVMRAAIDLDLPVLGLCRGMQMLNVACGGTLLQDIGTEAHWMQYLPVSLEPGSRLAKAFGTDAPQHCHHVHHQAVDALGDGLRVVGRAADGMLEAVELEAATWIVATQWLPEDNAADDAEQQEQHQPGGTVSERRKHNVSPGRGPALHRWLTDGLGALLVIGLRKR